MIGFFRDAGFWAKMCEALKDDFQLKVPDTLRVPDKNFRTFAGQSRRQGLSPQDAVLLMLAKMDTVPFVKAHFPYWDAGVAHAVHADALRLKRCGKVSDAAYAVCYEEDSPDMIRHLEWIGDLGR